MPIFMSRGSFFSLHAHAARFKLHAAPRASVRGGNGRRSSIGQKACDYIQNSGAGQTLLSRTPADPRQGSVPGDL
jgi:hypothetical protein